jgi:tight adherence protein B
MNERCTDLDRGRVAAAGAKLSGRMVAALPLLFVPFRPIGRAPMFDGIGIVTLVLGISLALAGMSWIARLVPAPPQRDDPEDRFVRSAVVLLRGGMPLRQALGVAAGSAGGEPRTASDHVALGASWGEALDLCSDPLLRSMSNVVDRGERLGASVTAELQELADRRRGMVERSFEARLRRAPVLMMVPLTLCVLPSFGFLALTPFVRGLVSG